MIKIIRVGNQTSVIFNDGTMIQRDLTEEEFDELQQLEDEHDIQALMIPDYQKKIKEYKETKDLFNLIEQSNILTCKGDSVYWEDVCELSMPRDFVEVVINAEKEENENKLEAYKNFWTLLSLNPDSRCRQNLWWFLNRYGMQISQEGLIVGYRNADILVEGEQNNKYSQELIMFVKNSYEKIKKQKQTPKKYTVEYNNILDTYELCRYNYDVSDDPFCLNTLYTYFNERYFDYDIINPKINTIYTDHHSHTFKIRIGEMVTMPREKCDSVQENSCSTGLHIGGASWLTKNYFGNQGLICLVNPADVVAVPPIDDYGKLRTCAYLPIGIVKFNSDGYVIPYNLEDGFKSEYVKEILYNGTKYSEDIAAYEFKIPDIPEINKEKITENLKRIAQKCIDNKEC